MKWTNMDGNGKRYGTADCTYFKLRFTISQDGSDFNIIGRIETPTGASMVYLFETYHSLNSAKKMAERVLEEVMVSASRNMKGCEL